MTVVVTGKVYNGDVHPWKDKDKNKRSMYRGRLNYRDRTSGEWHWIDVVCWKDFGDKDGLVGFLEKHFSVDSANAPKDKGGQSIEIVGYLRPSINKMTVPVTVSKKGEPFTFDVKNVDNPTYELVIETVDFPPSNEVIERKSSSKAKVDGDLDFDDIDESDATVLEEDDDEVEVKKTPKKKTAAEKKAAAKKKEAAAAKLAAAKKAAAELEDDDDDDELDEDDPGFFDN